MLQNTNNAHNPDLPDRRSFLAAGIAGGMLAISTAAGTQAERQNETSTVPPIKQSFELDELSIAELRQGMVSGKFTARSLVEQYLARIEAIDRSGPHLASVIEVNPDALALADQLDVERQSKGTRGPMHGIPVLIKDNIDTADKMATTAGSLALVGSKPPEDSFVVKQLAKRAP